MPGPDAGDLTVMEQAVRAAGAAVQSMGQAGVRHWTKPDGTPVTEADLAADAILNDTLAGARPHYGWLSEESGSRDSEARRVWIVDPIDGTSAFLSGKPDWCVAAALIEAGRPIAAAIHAPVTGEFFSAVAGGGAWRNGARLEVSETAALARAHVIAGAQALEPRRWQSPLPDGLTRHAVASLILRLCRVAEGRYDAMVSFGFKNDWDIAAGELMVAEAGGRLSDLDGTPLVYGTGVRARRGVIAAGRELHATIIGHGPQ